MRRFDESATASMVDDMIVYISCAAYNHARKWGAAMPSLVDCIDAIIAERERRKLPGPVQPDELPSNWTATMLFPDQDKKRMLSHCRILSFSEVLKKKQWGVLSSTSGVIAESREITIDPSGQTVYRTHLYRQANQKGPSLCWIPLTERPTTKEQIKMRYTGTHFIQYAESSYVHRSHDPGLLATAAWARQHLWSVELSMGVESASVLLVTDALGVKGFFDLRDKPEGKTRRDALQHWVRSHTRKMRDDADTERRVRQHVRGRTEFDWFGMHGIVQEPNTVPEPLPPRKPSRNSFAGKIEAMPG